ncbi:MAG: IS30 family transposase, partial [Paracoccaceae bacterium]|nr:IS30 family transposase [Paracoccaceae bacterium]
ALKMATYFCDAYASWQKGGIENANGRIRRWLPRQTDLDALTDEDIQDVAMTLNLTPRKCLGFRSPAEAFLNELGKELTIRFNAPVALRG